MPDNTVGQSIFDDQLYTPSSLSGTGGVGRSYGTRISNSPAIDAVAGMGFWKAEPGEYNHPGGAGGETFIVVEGEATIDISGLGAHELSPGVVINIPPNTPSTMTVRALLRKFSVVAK